MSRKLGECQTTSSSILKSLKLTSTLPAVTVGSITAGLQVAGLNPFEGSLVDFQKKLAESLAPESQPEIGENISVNEKLNAPKQQNNELIEPANYLSHFQPLSNHSLSTRNFKPQSEENSAAKEDGIDKPSNNHSFEENANSSEGECKHEV